MPTASPEHLKLKLFQIQASHPGAMSTPNFASPTSHQLPVDRGPAAEGVALKIRRTPRRGAAGREWITTEVLANTENSGSKPLPPAPGVKVTKKH